MIHKNKKWTVAFVNYKTAMYLKWQLKGLYEFNDPKDFELVIVDNSNPHEKEELSLITDQYQSQYGNIRIIYYSPIGRGCSTQHGEALTLAMSEANSKYLILQDPDYFWVKKDWLKWLEGFFENERIVAVGSPYTNGFMNAQTVGGNPDFPDVYGTAYNLELIQLLNLDFTALDNEPEKRGILADIFYHHVSNNVSDTGYRVRYTLSSPYYYDNFISFHYRMYDKTPLLKSFCFGYSSQDEKSRYATEYFYGNEAVGHHIGGGSLTAVISDINLSTGIEENNPIDKELIDLRDNVAGHFYSLLASDCEKITDYIGRHNLPINPNLELWIYGGGSCAKSFIEYLRNNGYADIAKKVKGIVVSNEHKTQDKFCGFTVFEQCQVNFNSEKDVLIIAIKALYEVKTVMEAYRSIGFYSCISNDRFLYLINNYELFHECFDVSKRIFI